jgi:hypothetical protein
VGAIRLGATLHVAGFEDDDEDENEATLSREALKAAVIESSPAGRSGQKVQSSGSGRGRSSGLSVGGETQIRNNKGFLLYLTVLPQGMGRNGLPDDPPASCALASKELRLKLEYSLCGPLTGVLRQCRSAQE